MGYKILRPPGLGLSSASTGRNPRAENLLHRLYGTSDPSEVMELWLAGLQSGRASKQLLLGVPSDTGGGAVRGAAFGPIGVREALYAGGPIDGFDLGDVFVLPHLLHDELLNDATLKAVHEALHGATDLKLPVSPLSITEYVVQQLNAVDTPPSVFSIGGDHSVTGALLPHLVASAPEDVALVVIDGHTDLETTRYGLPLTYSSWVNYADRRVHLPAIAQIGSPLVPGIVHPSSRLMLAGLDATHDLRSVTDQVSEWLKGHDLQSVYLSIDIDATSHQEAPATGLPAPDGLSRDAILEIIASLSANFTLRGGDVMEVAPPLSGRADWQNETTCKTAATYLRAMMSQN